MSRAQLVQPRCASIIVPVDTLEPEPIEIVKPFHVVVQPYEDEFVATFFDANISATGCTEQEAVANVKDMIVMEFNFLEPKADKDLGAALRRERSVLCAMLKRRR
ncbi:MAG: hypothetical protein ABSE73_20180 [Planctomycetota bacterium]